MKIVERYAKAFKRIFPSPFTLAILLSVLTLFLALINRNGHVAELAMDWQRGLWDSSLLTFAFQMMFMLVLGHVLALSTFFDRLILLIVGKLKNNSQAVFAITLCTMMVALFNWGLGLIFGAIMARKLGEYFDKNNIAVNYPLIGACGYSGLMVWHGGLSGSSLSKVAESGHLQSLASHLVLPERISYADTVFSGMNLWTTALLLVIIPLVMALIARKIPKPEIGLSKLNPRANKESAKGVERLETSRIFNKIIGLAICVIAIYIGWQYQGPIFGFIDPNYINFTLLGLAILLHGNFKSFLNAIDQAISGAAGILIQFPIYFGILALMKSGGLIEVCSSFFISNSTPDTYPIFTFLSAGLVNIFVPSGGGQWAIQGPIILEAAQSIGVPLEKCILAFAYGDQWTNMLQPFWALPLLSITGLKADDILPYTLLLFILGGIIFTFSLIVF